MDDWSVLLMLCLTMFIGSYAAGFVPLAFSFSEQKVRLLSILGAGLLIGTALSVIIPEGVEALQFAPHHHVHIKSNPTIHHQDTHKAKEILEGDKNAKDNNENPPRIVPKDAEMNPNVPVEINEHGDVKESEKNRRKRQVLEAEFDATGKRIHTNTEQEEQNHVEIGPKIGYSLVLGFLLMLLIDQITKQKQTGRQKITATVGLVVHAAVDGIALGSASMTDKSDIQLIVFMAIMLHKAPAAFGLTSILMMEGLERTKVKKHLFIFSASAPLAAIVTYLMVSKNSTDSLRSTSSTGILLLFSAGTFLYVATVHVIPELAEQGRKSRNDHILLSTNSTSPNHSNGSDFTRSELIILIIGSILPSILSIGHHH